MSSHTAQTELKLIGKLLLEGDITCQTGLHIGAGKGSLEIGGADNPVVKDAFGLPYIPGSSLRGKLRSMLEQSSGMAVPSELVYLSKRKGQEVRIHQSDRPDDDICLLFGRSPGRMDRVSGEPLESSVATPARLTMYDAPLIPESITPQMRENMDDELTEVKSENAIDRITSQANPRTLERVPAGARFHFRIVMDVLCPEDRELLPRLVEGLRLLEDDSLGGGGSRGSGRVALSNLKLAWRGRTFYASGARFHFRIVMDVLCPEDRELLPRLVEGLRLLEDDSLGGGGSRGSGRVALSNLKLAWRGRTFYASGAAEQELIAGADLGALQALVTGAEFADKLVE